RLTPRRRHPPGPSAVLGDGGANGAHGGESESDIARGPDVPAGQGNLNGGIAEGGGHQQGRDILAREGRVDLDPALTEATRAPNGDRWAAGGALSVDAELIEGINQRTDWKEAHVLVAVNDDGAIDSRNGGRQKAGGRAGIAEGQRRGGRREAAKAGDEEARRIRLGDLDAHR